MLASDWSECFFKLLIYQQTFSHDVFMSVVHNHYWLSISVVCTLLGFILEKAMAPHSSTLAWKIPGMAEPGGLPPMGSHRIGHNWSDLAAAGFIQSLRNTQKSSFAKKMSQIILRYSIHYLITDLIRSQFLCLKNLDL